MSTERIVLDLLMTYGYIDAVIVLFRVNTYTYYNLNIRPLIQILKFNDKDDVQDLKDLYIKRLIKNSISIKDYDECVKLMDRYEHYLYISKIQGSLGWKSIFEYTIKNGCENLFTYFIVTYGDIITKYYKSNKVSMIRYDRIEMISILKDNLYPNISISSLLTSTYPVCNSKEMYNYLRSNNVPITNTDIKYITHESVTIIPKILTYIFEDNDEGLYKIKDRIWRRCSNLHKEYILKHSPPEICVRLISYDYACNMNIETCVECMGINRVKEGLNKVDVNKCDMSMYIQLTKMVSIKENEIKEKENSVNAVTYSWYNFFFT